MQAAWLMFEDRWLDCRIVVVRMEQWWIGELIGSGLRCGVCLLLRWWLAEYGKRNWHRLKSSRQPCMGDYL